MPVTRYMKVAPGASQISMPNGRSYNAGDSIEWRLDDPETTDRIGGSAADAYSNYSVVKSSIAKLVTAGILIDSGTVSQPEPGSVAPWSIPVSLPTINNTGEVARIRPGFAGRVVGWSFLATVDATTDLKAASLVMTIQAKDGTGARQVGASGNPATLDLTSANVTNGGIVPGETIVTGPNPGNGDFGADDVIVISATGVTAFVEGAGVVNVSLQRNT